ncbi:UDP-2,3-diacylglucosamine hydrolase [Shewanella sp. Choline-02u-19]|uniref:UDP-2,3-diacylglucosamine diphosphatase n=1 Tax=unclassified Shewanella TaxID=196818 RepID=UPI000C341B3D|nr:MULTISPECIES: UDP-2,3-diacylglucosamine diphosphatase [unclassified Shewanella]PKG75074.1 UDP-2,3-diacylglucosamine hydrolase [Shewanella sp. GutCb]PKH54835.1 UDP-2,3-diacylglucosamine hydrolase [Shewanella sp. Bg11-22]PKI26607.1 UDP-2,3-diacylglucosamine hydrolase [Shewanella sp. Choline-02u-19]
MENKQQGIAATELENSLGDRSLPPQNDTVKPINSARLNQAQHYNAIWLSDVHLGSKDCKAEYLLQLLNSLQTDILFLVGDIFDIWALKRKFLWPQSHNLVLQKLLKMAREGTRIVYIPGNHDEALKPYDGFCLLDLTITKEHIHTTVSGRKVLVLHGDQFDSEVCIGRAYAKLGDHLYDLLLFLNRQLHKVRSQLGYPYWSLASYVKLRVSKAQQAIKNYRNAVTRYAKRMEVDVVVCGHIHQPELTVTDNMVYANDGDWVENCTFIAESDSGDIQLLKWQEATACARLISAIQFSQHSGSPMIKRVA